MKPVYQTKFGKGAGNCLAACVASLLDLEITDVFDIADGGLDPNYWLIVDTWLADRGLGLAYVTIGMQVPGEETTQSSVRIPANMNYLAWGRSPRDLQHSVIYHGGTLVHDPHPQGGGIATIEQIAFLVKLT